MRILASIKVRIFLVAWILFAAHFATNVVREHYPAFGLAEHGTLRCDPYLGFHSDIFQHQDGHAYIANNVFASALAAVPLWIFDPLLDALEAHSRRRLASPGAAPEPVYDTVHPNRQELYRRVVLAGLDLRFGAAAAITATLFMAPLSAAVVVLMFHVLLGRGLARRRAVWLAFLFGFGTPVFYRTAHLSHNLLLMEAVFASFVLLWVRPGRVPPSSAGRRFAAGLFAGCGPALDYSGFVPCLALGLYLVSTRRRSAPWSASLREALPFVAGCLPGLFFLGWSQWAMFGSPLVAPQFVMPVVNFTDEGLRGLSWPSVEVFLKNLFAPGWGLVPFAPLLMIALVPARRYRRERWLVPADERRFVWGSSLAFLLFCAANRYSLMQFNTGFRYLLPVVPFLFLLACEHLARLRARTLLALSVPILLHTWVLTTMRVVRDTEQELRDLATSLGVSELQVEGAWRRLLTETALPLSYRRLLEEGPQLPWLSVLARTQPDRAALLGSPFLALGILALAGGIALWTWRTGARAEALRIGPPAIRPPGC